MIRFFRHIRQKLFSIPREGQHASPVARYLLYAIGEIVLVVIGILIALQINTWNEGLKERKLEKSTLIEIKKSLELDIQNFEEQIKSQLRTAHLSTTLLNHIKSGEPYTNDLDGLWERVVRYFFVDFNTSAFSLLESRGIDIIKNEMLRKKIVDHYNLDQTKMKRSSEVSEHLSNENLVYFFDRVYPEITPDFEETFDYKNEKWAPKDYELLVSDPSLVPKISHNIKVRYRFSQLLKEFIEKEKILVKEIENELQNEFQ